MQQLTLPAAAATASSTDSQPPIMQATNWSKRFGGRLVLDGVDLVVQAGEVHALCGQNGSGKSTLIKILAGFHTPEPGAGLQLNGERVSLPFAPGAAGRSGVAFVHQDLGLNETATVTENLRAGRYARRSLSPISWREQRRSIVRLLHDGGLDGVTPEMLVADLPSVDRTLLAMARAMEDLRHVERGLLVLDEPTAYLPRDGVDRLFAAVRGIAGRGFGVLFVSHDLDEVAAISNRVTVLRDGGLVGTFDITSLSPAELTEKILGFELSELYPGERPSPGDTVASVAGLGGGALAPISFDVRAGEILGLTGLLGSGHDALPYLMVGVMQATSGSVAVDGEVIPASQITPHRAVRAGVAVVPANRARDGVLGSATATENVTLATLGRHFRRGVLRRREEVRRAAALSAAYEVRPPNPHLPLAMFSGGNQQKLVLAKWLEAEPRVLVLHEPTQGVDVGSRRALLARVAQAAEAGAAVIVCSTEYEDLAHLCDRVLVLRRGDVIADLGGTDLTHERILELCYGQTGAMQ